MRDEETRETPFFAERPQSESFPKLFQKFVVVKYKKFISGATMTTWS